MQGPNLDILQAKVAVQTDAKRRMHEVQGTICSKASNVVLGVTALHMLYMLHWKLIEVSWVLEDFEAVFGMGSLILW